MVKRIRVFMCVTLFIATAFFTAGAMAKATVPGRTASRVNDYAGIIDKDTADYLNKRIASMPQRTEDPVEVVVATFNDTQGWGIKAFAEQYGENWRRTKLGRDNGVMLMIFPSAGRVFIGVGQNLTEIVTEDKVSDIINNTMVPMFKEGRYSEMIRQAAEEIITTLEKTDIPEYEKNFSILIIAIAVIIAILAAIVINVRISKR